MIPHFKHNLINYVEEKDESGDKHIEETIAKVVQGAIEGGDKLDRRVIKNIDFTNKEVALMMNS